MNVTLYEYQDKAINEIVGKGLSGARKLVFQLATGGGKTVTFCALIDLYLRANPGQKALVLVHRKPLLSQARKTLLNNHGLFAEAIVADKKYPDLTRPVFVAMVDTMANRIAKFPNILNDVGLVIIDECHIGNFSKLHNMLPNQFIFGFSATPISANKKLPLNELYDDIVTAVDIPDLIKMGALSPNRTLSVKGVNRAILKMNRGEFNEREMGNEYSAPKHVENCVKKYREHADGKKAIVFNCNIDHSNLVHNAFLAAGYESRHIDSTMPDGEIEAAYKWFRDTPGAILNNVGKATTGYDEPSIDVVIVNRSTTSVALWLQMCGRGSRRHPGKENFIIIDLGGNARAMGDWSQPRNWASIFHNPPKAGTGEGLAPMKTCPQCESFVAAQVKICEYCGFEFENDEQRYDTADPDLEWIESKIRVNKFIEQTERSGYKPYAALHIIKSRIVDAAHAKDPNMSEARYYKLLAGYQGAVKEWCKLNGKPYNTWHKVTSSEWFMGSIKEKFRFEVAPLLINL